MPPYHPSLVSHLFMSLAEIFEADLGLELGMAKELELACESDVA